MSKPKLEYPFPVVEVGINKQGSTGKFHNNRPNPTSNGPITGPNKPMDIPTVTRVPMNETPWGNWR